MAAGSTGNVPFDPANPLSWIQGGIFVVIVLTLVWMFYKEWIVPGPSVQRLVADLKLKDQIIAEKDIALARKEEVIAGLHSLIEERELATMYKVNSVLGDVMEMLKNQRMRAQVKAELGAEKESRHGDRDPR